MRAVKRVNLDVATHAVTGGMLINRSIFCSPFFMNRHPSLFRDRSRRPMSLHGSLFQKNKKLDTLPSVTVILPCSPKHHKAIPDRLLFPRVARLFTDALRGFLHCFSVVRPFASRCHHFAGDNGAQSRPTLSRAGFVRRGKYDNPWATPV